MARTFKTADTRAKRAARKAEKHYRDMRKNTRLK